MYITANANIFMQKNDNICFKKEKNTSTICVLLLSWKKPSKKNQTMTSVYPQKHELSFQQCGKQKERKKDIFRCFVLFFCFSYIVMIHNISVYHSFTYFVLRIFDFKRTNESMMNLSLRSGSTLSNERFARRGYC